ncbi:MAG: hypothetical protein J6X00_00320 [Clostridia bacterium]|nr:hypothetical protein [Clostridia bacterium]
MKSVKSQQNSYRIKNSIFTFLKKYKTYIVTLSIALVIGIVTGLFTCSRYADVITISNIPDKNLVKFLCGDRGSIGLFFNYFICYSLLIAAIIFLNNSLILNLINYVYYLVLGYILGFTIFALIALFSFVGILNGLLVILPFALILYVILIILSSLAIYRYKIYKKYGCTIGTTNYTKVYLILYACFVFVLLIWCFVLPLIKITIIV